MVGGHGSRSLLRWLECCGWFVLEVYAPVRAGDCVVIPSGVAPKLWADEREPLILVCCCAPAYAHADTELLED
jgi:mannose-6-phosphate isomerase-like protein (cupin superfamily)